MRAGMIIHPEELTKRWIDRLASAGADVLGIHPWGGGRAKDSLKELVDTLKTEEFRELIDYAKSRGLKIEYELHAVGYLLPRELFDTHPEYFRMNARGERVNDYNLCVTNKEALALLGERAAALAENLYGSEDKFYFWLDDGKGLHCHCDSCRALSPSDQQLIALNTMLRAVKKKNPRAKMAYLAYFDSLTPPTAAEPEEGIFLEYAPMYKYTAKGEDAEALISGELAALPALLDTFGRGDAKVLEYWYDNSMYSKWTKPPLKFTLDEARMAEDISEYKRLGFADVATFACFLGEDYTELYGDFDILPFVANSNLNQIR